jgi:site-specific recombinase XerD
MASSGLRRAELAALVLDDVDLTARTLVVQHGKGNKRRVAVLSSSKAVLALGRYLRRRAKEGRPRDDRVFISLRSRRGLTPSGVSQVLDGISRKAGVDFHPHQLRHTWADAILSTDTKQIDVQTLAAGPAQRCSSDTARPGR